MRCVRAFPFERSTSTHWCAMRIGRKMSKMKGNVLDPIEVIGQYGTDATRFTLASMAAAGTDIAFSESRTAGVSEFCQQDMECGALHVHERE